MLRNTVFILEVHIEHEALRNPAEKQFACLAFALASPYFFWTDFKCLASVHRLGCVCIGYEIRNKLIFLPSSHFSCQHLLNILSLPCLFMSLPWSYIKFLNILGSALELTFGFFFFEIGNLLVFLMETHLNTEYIIFIS